MADIGKKIVPFTKAGKITLHALADLQYGSKSCDTWLLRQKLRDIVSDPTGGMSVILGDLTDDDRPTTRMMMKASMAGRPEVLDSFARDKKTMIDKDIIPMLLPLASTKLGIIGVLAGHHWAYVKVKDHAGVRYVNSAKYICHELGRLTKRSVPYLGVMSAWIGMTFLYSTGQSVKRMIHIQHGTGGGQTLASALNKLEATSRWAQADLLIRAHDCKLVSAKTVRLGPREDRGGNTPKSLKAKNIALLNIGSMTRGYLIGEDEPDYVEMEMMRPVAMGWGQAHFHLRKSSKSEDPSSNWTADLTVEI